MSLQHAPAKYTVSAEERNHISQGLYAYCRGLDRFDKPLALSPFVAGARFHYSELFVGDAEGFIDWVWKLHEPLSLHVHRIANIYIERTQAGELVSESYVQVLLRAEADGQITDTIGRGRYVDRWVSTEGQFLIAERDFITDAITTTTFQSPQPLDGHAAERPAALACARGPEDASYRLLAD
jgi:hypothetical protein